MSTLYLRHEDKHGSVSVQSHQVWDRERFLEAQKVAAEKEGGVVTEVNQETYRRHNWPGHGNS